MQNRNVIHEIYFNKIKLSENDVDKIIIKAADVIDFDEILKRDSLDTLNFLKKINSFQEPFKIFRVIYAHDLKKINYKNLGESWSFLKKSAIEFFHINYSRKSYTILSGNVYFNNINWEETISRYFLYSSGNDKPENEIVVINTRKIKNLHIVKKDNL